MTSIAPYVPSNNAFRICEPCIGMGFLKKNDFADRKFVKCEPCGGIGQIYLAPVTKPKT